jgi:hypothetical protein
VNVRSSVPPHTHSHQHNAQKHLDSNLLQNLPLPPRSKTPAGEENNARLCGDFVIFAILKSGLLEEARRLTAVSNVFSFMLLEVVRRGCLHNRGNLPKENDNDNRIHKADVNAKKHLKIPSNSESKPSALPGIPNHQQSTSSTQPCYPPPRNDPPSLGARKVLVERRREDCESRNVLVTIEDNYRWKELILRYCINVLASSWCALLVFSNVWNRIRRSFPVECNRTGETKKCTHHNPECSVVPINQ